MVPIAPFAIFGSVYQASDGMPVLLYLIGMAALLFTASSYWQIVRAFRCPGRAYNYETACRHLYILTGQLVQHRGGGV